MFKMNNEEPINEIKKHPNWESNTYGWWKKDGMFDGLITE